MKKWEAKDPTNLQSDSIQDEIFSILEGYEYLSLRMKSLDFFTPSVPIPFYMSLVKMYLAKNSDCDFFQIQLHFLEKYSMYSENKSPLFDSKEYELPKWVNEIHVQQTNTLVPQGNHTPNVDYLQFIRSFESCHSVVGYNFQVHSGLSDSSKSELASFIFRPLLNSPQNPALFLLSLGIPPRDLLSLTTCFLKLQAPLFKITTGMSKNLAYCIYWILSCDFNMIPKFYEFVLDLDLVFITLLCSHVLKAALQDWNDKELSSAYITKLEDLDRKIGLVLPLSLLIPSVPINVYQFQHCETLSVPYLLSLYPKVDSILIDRVQLLGFKVDYALVLAYSAFNAYKRWDLDSKLVDLETALLNLDRLLAKGPTSTLSLLSIRTFQKLLSSRIQDLLDLFEREQQQPTEQTLLNNCKMDYETCVLFLQFCIRLVSFSLGCERRVVDVGLEISGLSSGIKNMNDVFGNMLYLLPKQMTLLQKEFNHWEMVCRWLLVSLTYPTLAPTVPSNLFSKNDLIDLIPGYIGSDHLTPSLKERERMAFLARLSRTGDLESSVKMEELFKYLNH